MAASAILMIGFSTFIMFSRKQLNDTNTRVHLGYDQVLIDNYIRTKLTTTVSDSMRIYASKSDENAGSTSSSGIILRAVDSDSTVHYLETSGSLLHWMVDSTLHVPVDCDVANLLFEERTGNFGKILDVSVDLVAEGDTLSCEWTITLRN